MPTSAETRLAVRVVTLLLAGAVVLWFLYLIRGVLLIVYVSTLLAIGFSPAVRWIERHRVVFRRRRLPRWAAILVLYVGVLAAIAIVLAVIVPPVVTQATELWRAMPGYVDRAQRGLVDAGLLGSTWTWSEVLGYLPSPGLAVSGLLGAIQSTLGAIGAIVTVLLLPYYLLVEAESLQRGFLRLVASGREARVARITADVTVRIGAWLSGQLLLAFLIGGVTTLALWILGVPYFYVLGLLAGIGEFIPVVGPIVAAVPAVLMGWTVSLKTAILVAAFFGVQQFLENNVLVPRLMERQVGVSAVTVIVALLVGTQLLGIVGAILAVPTAAIGKVLLQEYLDREPA